MATTSNFVKMLQEIRGTSGIGATLSDGYYYEIAVKDYDGNLGMYGDIVAKHTGIISADTSVEANKTAAELAATNASVSATTATTKAAEAVAAESVVAASADAANTSAVSASASATSASNDAASALASKNSAATDAVSTAADAALTAVDASTSGTNAANAATSASNASNSESAAATSATSASNSATSANTDSLLARDWATKDTAIIAAVDNNGTPLYSSRKYADDAMSYRDEIANMSAEAVDVDLGGTDGNTIGTPTASYDSITGILTLGIPHGRMQRIESVVPQLEAGVPNGELTFNFTDGTDYTTPSLKGADGDTGPAGDHEEVTGFVSNGDGTYDISFKYGTTRTTMDITGPQGPAGNPGIDVRSVHWISNSAGSPENTASTVDTYGVYSTTTQDAEAQLGTFTVYNGANGSGVGDMLYAENLAGLTDVPLARSNLGVDSSLQVNNKILVAVPAQSGVISGTCLTTDGSVTSWGYNPNIGSW